MGIDKFRRKIVTPALDGKSGMQGVTSIASGYASVVVSATQVVSGVAVPQVTLGQTTVASHRTRSLSVNSVVDNTSFMIVSDEALVDTQAVVFTIIG